MRCGGGNEGPEREAAGGEAGLGHGGGEAVVGRQGRGGRRGGIGEEMRDRKSVV